MAWETYVVLNTGTSSTVEFDFTQYLYRAMSITTGTLGGRVYSRNATTNTYIVFTTPRMLRGTTEGEAVELTEGMVTGSQATPLSQGANTLYLSSSATYADIRIERFALNTEPAQPGIFTKPSLSLGGTLRAGETYRFEWGASFDPDLGDTVYYRVFQQLNGAGAYTTVAIVTVPYYNHTIPEGITSLSLRVYPFNDATPNPLDNVPRDSPKYLVTSGFELYPKVNGLVREIDSMSVKANGVVREVESVWIKTNGILREV